VPPPSWKRHWPLYYTVCRKASPTPHFRATVAGFHQFLAEVLSRKWAINDSIVPAPVARNLDGKCIKTICKRKSDWTIRSGRCRGLGRQCANRRWVYGKKDLWNESALTFKTRNERSDKRCLHYRPRRHRRRKLVSKCFSMSPRIRSHRAPCSCFPMGGVPGRRKLQSVGYIRITHLDWKRVSRVNFTNSDNKYLHEQQIKRTTGITRFSRTQSWRFWNFSRPTRGHQKYLGLLFLNLSITNNFAKNQIMPITKLAIRVNVDCSSYSAYVIPRSAHVTTDVITTPLPPAPAAPIKTSSTDYLLPVTRESFVSTQHRLHVARTEVRKLRVCDSWTELQCVGIHAMPAMRPNNKTYTVY